MYIRWLNQYYFDLFRNKDFHHLLREQLLSYISWLTWGYGEKPFRIIFNSLCIILLFSGIYFFSSNQNLSNNSINSIYYSIITFTTLGYGDIVPNTDGLKLVSAIEALIGAFSMGLIIAGYTTKVRS
jgi:glucose uptake protein GlcU